MFCVFNNDTMLFKTTKFTHPFLFTSYKSKENPYNFPAYTLTSSENLCYNKFVLKETLRFQSKIPKGSNALVGSLPRNATFDFPMLLVVAKRKIHNRLLCLAIVMCLVARNCSRHGTTQNNGNEIGRFRCVMCFCNTFVIFVFVL